MNTDKTNAVFGNFSELPSWRLALAISVCATAFLVFAAVSLAEDKDAPKLEPTPLNPQKTVWLDREGGKLLLKSEVVLTRGSLEMLLCKKGTKEHESILAVDSDAAVIHGGLIVLGATPGSPVQFQPDFKPPQGQQIEIYLNWKDKAGKSHRSAARRWVRTSTERYFAVELKALPPGIQLTRKDKLRFDERNEELTWYGPMSDEQFEQELARSANEVYQKAVRELRAASQTKPLDADFVFAGSGIYVDPNTKQRFYEAEGGDVICVANFPSAMIDISARSSSTGTENLVYEAWTERVPPEGTKVTVELVPVKSKEKGKESDESIR
ncbi:YdjY domain-containing protein [Stratiformator vulcanicus]|uniref:Uncharacterized protein n=1 Tax=Stratiformator vulcanicus TaxID=2527980 RepID=A0A517R203_9PLAN|nr:YdjY domain-containing protein [Stratiformator vulcanicus]QDT37917.1 hypothetical protein Pan189_23000 [Stratiformator vulcanicus]